MHISMHVDITRDTIHVMLEISSVAVSDEVKTNFIMKSLTQKQYFQSSLCLRL